VEQLEKDPSDYLEQPAIKDITHRHHTQTHTHLTQKYYWSTEYTFTTISAAENNTCIKISEKMNISIHFPHFLYKALLLYQVLSLSFDSTGV